MYLANLTTYYSSQLESRMSIYARNCTVNAFRIYLHLVTNYDNILTDRLHIDVHCNQFELFSI